MQATFLRGLHNEAALLTYYVTAIEMRTEKEALSELGYTFTVADNGINVKIWEL